VKQLAIVLAVAAAAVGLLYYATLAGAGVECEACMHYEGRQACRSATGVDREEAERTAIATACALISNGVTGTIRCQGLVPDKLECTAR
jgi:hypothetical protein